MGSGASKAKWHRAQAHLRQRAALERAAKVRVFDLLGVVTRAAARLPPEDGGPDRDNAGGGSTALLVVPCAATLLLHTNRVSCLAFHPKGHKLASSSADSTIKITDVQSRAWDTTLSGHAEAVWCVAFDPRDGSIASGSVDCFKLWDVNSFLKTRYLGTVCDSAGFHARTVREHTDSVSSLAFYDCGGRHRLGLGARIASASHDETIKLWCWDVLSGALECLATLRGHEDAVMCVAFDSAGGLLVSGSFDTTVKCWDVARIGNDDKDTRANLNQEDAVGTCVATMAGHTKPISSVSCDPKGRYFASASFDETIKLWSVSNQACVATLQTNQLLRAVAFSPGDGNHLACGGGGGVQVWDVLSTKCVASLHGHNTEVLTVAFQPQGRLLASGDESGTVKLWDTTVLINEFWQARHHHLHTEAVKECVSTVMLVANQHIEADQQLFWLPLELWLCILGLLRNSDFRHTLTPHRIVQTAGWEGHR